MSGEEQHPIVSLTLVGVVAVFMGQFLLGPLFSIAAFARYKPTAALHIPLALLGGVGLIAMAIEATVANLSLVDGVRYVAVLVIVAGWLARCAEKAQPSELTPR